MLLWHPPQEFVCGYLIYEECAPHIPVARLIFRSGFGDAIGSVEDASSDDIQEITFLVGCSMWNDSAV